MHQTQKKDNNDGQITVLVCFCGVINIFRVIDGKKIIKNENYFILHFGTHAEF